MKVLQLGKYYYPTFGGLEHVMYEITHGLNEDGIECNVLCSNTKPFYEESRFDNYSVYRTASYATISSTSITPQIIYKLFKIHKDYDIIHVHHPDPMTFLALFLVRPTAKVVVHWHSDIIRQQKTLKYFLPLQNWVLDFSTKIIATSQNYVDYSTHLQKFIDKVEVIPIGISDDKFITNTKDIDAIQKEYEGKKIILGMGRLVSYKGFSYLIESAKYLSDEYMILIGGSGPDEEALLRTIASHKLQNRVKLLGHISEQEKYNYFKASSLFCLASITKAEAFGVVLLEAMAFSKPIVSTNIKESGMSWVNKENVSGLQVDSKSPKLLANAFKKLLSDDKTYREFCDNSFKRYQTLFTKKEMIKSLKKLYTSIL
jgi:rhamnosyl/mannosyltransferase